MTATAVIDMNRQHQGIFPVCVASEFSGIGSWIVQSGPRLGVLSIPVPLNKPNRKIYMFIWATESGYVAELLLANLNFFAQDQLVGTLPVSNCELLSVMSQDFGCSRACIGGVDQVFSGVSYGPSYWTLPYCRADWLGIFAPAINLMVQGNNVRTAGVWVASPPTYITGNFDRMDLSFQISTPEPTDMFVYIGCISSPNV